MGRGLRCDGSLSGSRRATHQLRLRFQSRVGCWMLCVYVSGRGKRQLFSFKNPALWGCQGNRPPSYLEFIGEVRDAHAHAQPLSAATPGPDARAQSLADATAFCHLIIKALNVASILRVGVHSKELMSQIKDPQWNYSICSCLHTCCLTC